MSVYFAVKDDLIKIGYSGNPKQRARGLGATLLAVMPGERRMERVIHGIFEEYRSHGEWFHAGVRLWNFVEALNGDDTTFDLPNEYRRNEMSDFASAFHAQESSDRLGQRPLVVFA